MMKNVTRNKLLLCFRPVVLELESDGGTCSSKKLFAYIAVENKEDMKISTNESTLSDSDSAEILEKYGRPSRPKRTFSKIVKAVLFQTSLSKTVCDRKISQYSFRSRSSSNRSSKSDDSMKFEDDKPTKMKSIDPDAQAFMKSKSSSMRSLSSLSSSSSSSCLIREANATNSSNHDYINKEQKINSQLNRNLMGFSSFNNGLYLIFVSLTVTIFWGKFCAVLLTSTWLYFYLRQRKLGEKTSETVSRWPEMESRDYKKRVIMEGLLERNHHHHQNKNKGSINFWRENSSFRV